MAPYNGQIWSENLLKVAFEIVYQKFSKVPGFDKIILDTGNSIIVEATKKDNKWGVGISKKDIKVSQPWEWPDHGLNILGWALMSARETIKEDK